MTLQNMCPVDSVTLMWWGGLVCCDPMEQEIYHMVVEQFLVVVHFLPNLRMHPCTHTHTAREWPNLHRRCRVRGVLQSARTSVRSVCHPVTVPQLELSLCQYIVSSTYIL